MPDWGNYNGYYPCIPTSVGLEAGDGVCLVDYDMPDAEGGNYHTFHVPVFFGLVTAGYGSLWRWVRGLIMDAGEEKSEVYVSPSMYAQFNPSSVEGMLKACECPQQEGYIKRLSYNRLCLMPTEVGGSASTYYPDYFYTNAATSKGLRVRAAGGGAGNGTNAGAFLSSARSTAADANAGYSSPLCYFEADPVIS